MSAIAASVVREPFVRNGHMGKTIRNAAIAFTVATLFFKPADVAADGAIAALMSQRDKAVLAEFDARREAAISRARNASDPTLSATLNTVLSGKALSFDDGYDPSGDWRCRLLKLGGDPELSIYRWFSCRIFDDGAGWVVQKTGGSQRIMGRLYRLTAERLVYLGALHYAYEAPMWFGQNPARNQLAVLTRLDDGRMRLEFPAPLAESAFDILELAP